MIYNPKNVDVSLLRAADAGVTAAEHDVAGPRKIE
jgi:hypothetical protein